MDEQTDLIERYKELSAEFNSNGIYILLAEIIGQQHGSEREPADRLPELIEDAGHQAGLLLVCESLLEAQEAAENRERNGR